MARVTFVQLYSPMNLYPFIMPTVGPYILAEVLRRQGHRVSVLCEPPVKVYDRRTGTLHEHIVRAEVVGFSIMTATATYAYEIAEAIRKRQPSTRIVFGGPHATFCPQEVLQHGDVVVIGEAESVIHTITESTCPAVLTGGPVEDLDALPWPDFSTTPGLERAMKYVPISTSRGCPYNCRFCSVTQMFGRRYRFRSAENILEEVRYHLLHGRHKFFFTDDNFAARPSRLRRLLEGILKHKLPVRWVAQVRMEMTRDKELLKMAARSGCGSLLIGFESPSDEVLKSYNKRQSASEMVRCIHNVKESGIWVHGLFMLGSDEDDVHSGERTVAFCKDTGVDIAQFSILTPFPGTDIYRQFSNEGRIFTQDWPLFDGAHAVFRPAKLTAMALQKMWLKTWKRFYSLSRPIYYLMCRVLLHKWKRGSRQFKNWLQSLYAESRPALG